MIVRIRLIALSIVALAFMAAGVRADEKNWGNEAELSCVKSAGNSQVTTFAGKNTLTVKQGRRLVYTWEVGALYGESEGQRNSERYLTTLRGDYLFTERIYISLLGGWEKDSFTGIDDRCYVGPVGGYKLLTGPKHLLAVEAGADYTEEEYTDNTDSDFMRGRFFTKYQYLFTEKNRFLQSVESLHDFTESGNYDVNTITSITSAITDELSLKASYRVSYDNNPVPDTLNDTDTLLVVALVINI
jgi:putative salt-induced outer membrane protein